MSLVEAKEAFVVSWGDSLNVFACRRRDVNCLSCPSVGRWTRTDPSNLLLLNRVAASSDITEVVSAPRPVKAGKGENAEDRILYDESTSAEGREES
jgi:hypothetical protein